MNFLKLINKKNIMEKKYINNWEEEFDKEFGYKYSGASIIWDNVDEEIKQFIQLHSQKIKDEIVEERCQCKECKIKYHYSDCDVHNEPAEPKGECTCTPYSPKPTLDE